MTRIVIAGFLHETNTFARTPADWDNFVNGEGFPRMHTGAEVFDLAEVNIPMGGFLTDAAPDWELLPVIWCAASPSAPVTDRAFDEVCRRIVQACQAESPDAVYLDLHGAMVTASHRDGDGEVLRRVREAVGPQVPIVVSLDLHANMSEAMFDHADAMVAYRTYPHVDMADTGRRSAAQLRQILAGEQLKHHREHLDFLIPINSGSTFLEPAKSLYAELDVVADEEVMLTFAAAFPATDTVDCRPCIFGYGSDPEQVGAEVARITALAATREAEFALAAQPAREVIAEAAGLVARGVRPVVIADTQDNPGAGGDATTTGVLRELLAADRPRSALAAIWAPEVVQKATSAGIGTTVEIEFTGSGMPGDEPLADTFEVLDLTDGRVHFDGPMMHGNELAVGPSCLLGKGNVEVVVNSRKAQIMDRNQFRSAGVDPDAMDLLVVKSSVHFRGDFQPTAGAVLVALAPGPMAADPKDLPWTALAAGVRLGPLGPPFGE